MARTNFDIIRGLMIADNTLDSWICETEYIMCFVHFNHSTKEREGIYFSVWDFCGLLDSPIIVELSENETEMLYDYALEKIKLN